MSEVSTMRGSRTKAEQRARSMEMILDAAEYLFSKSGYHGVSIRDVADRVGIHTSLLHYYFDDKRNLFDAVFRRRAEITNARRMAAFEKYEAEAGNHPTIGGALHAFLDTDLDLYSKGGEPWMNYAAFVARIANSREGADMWKTVFDPAVLKLIDILKRALPHHAEEDIFWGFHFVTGALVYSIARNGRIDHLSAGLCHSDDFSAIKQRLATFMAGGFLALEKQKPSKTKTAPRKRRPRQSPARRR